ncbi:MAG: amidohydrolase [Oscillospiraceae bacterium]|nr:amidohydrolase [Oscillospiraceae bacterium]
MSELMRRVDAVEPEIRAIWQQLHQNPERGMALPNTAKLIEAELLAKTGVEVHRVGEAGIWAVLRGGKPGGDDGVLMLRGDMDALPIQEATDLPYASRSPGVMHACGHDVHASSLLGAVRVLEQYRDQIPGEIWFFFQPGEEVLQGAKSFLADPHIDFSRVRACAGCHVLGFTEVGKVSVRYGSHLASLDALHFTVRGRGAHASTPNETVDAMVVAAELIMKLQVLLSREVNPSDMANLTLGYIRAGEPDRVGWVADRVELGAGMRTVNPATRTRLLERIQAICDGLSLATRAEIDFSYENQCPALWNTPALCDVAVRAVEHTLGAQAVELAPSPALGAEDFAFYTQHFPGVFLSIGCRTPGRDSIPAHTPEFYTDPGTIRTCIAAYAAFALEYFGVALGDTEGGSDTI